jgi:hypothetical protein
MGWAFKCLQLAVLSQKKIMTGPWNFKFMTTRVWTVCFLCSRLRLKCDGTRAETRFRLSAKRTSPFKSVGASVQSTASSRGVRISCSNAGYTMLRGSVRVLATHSIREFPLHFPTRTSPCAIRFQLDSKTRKSLYVQTRDINWKYRVSCR